MNLVNELQVSAERDDVLTVLRKTKRLASKLNRDDIGEWLTSEQDGYPSAKSVPEYRNVGTTLVFRSTGWIPAGFNQIMKGIQDLNFNPGITLGVPDAISTVLSWLNEKNENYGVFTPVPAESELAHHLSTRMNPVIRNQVTFMFRYNMPQIEAIPEQIKDRVLDWALALERAGVVGEGMTFSAKEKEIAHNVTFNIFDSTIGQLSNSGSNVKRA